MIPAYSKVDKGEAPRLCIGIATRNRSETLRETLAELARQSIPPTRVIVCASCVEDVKGSVPAGFHLLLGAAGLPRQRNQILAEAADCDILLYLDDDFIPAPCYVAATLAAFADPSIVATTGTLLADGVKGPGIAPAEARRLIAADAGPDPGPAIVEAQHGYGCNMAIRLATAQAHDVRFDERLPLYGWSEDVDYTHRLRRHGRLVKLAQARGVHLGTKQGRAPGRSLGYSQVANPLYLRGKGSYSWGRALRSVGRNIAANIAHAAWPEAWIDRRGRLRGNLLALTDLLAGRMAPERILEL